MEEVRHLRAELTDRYGAIPPPAARLLRLAELRIQAAGRGIARIETRDHRAWLFRAQSRDPFLVRGALPQLAGRAADQKLDALFRLLETASQQ